MIKIGTRVKLPAPTPETKTHLQHTVGLDINMVRAMEKKLIATVEYIKNLDKPPHSYIIVHVSWKEENLKRRAWFPISTLSPKNRLLIRR